MKPIKILVQTTTPATADDWPIARFALLGQFLRDQRSGAGEPLFAVTARDRDAPGSPDSVLSTNFHSGANGDYQKIEVVNPVHPVLAAPGSPTGAIRFLPSHPHEGDVSAPAGRKARVIATGTSKATGRRFNIAVAFESDAVNGPGLAQSTYHHFADYNWDIRSGAPSFVTEAPGDGIMREPMALPLHA